MAQSEHDSWGMISTSRISGGGQIVFDSELTHNTTVALRINRAERHRDVGRSWNFPREQVIEIRMSESQWASMVAGMNNGNGTSCTITWLTGVGSIKPAPIEQSEADRHTEDFERDMKRITRDLAKFVVDARALAAATAPSKKSREALAGRAAMIVQDIESNLPFIHKSFREAMETVLAQAKTDFETAAIQTMAAHGIAPGEIDVPRLMEGIRDDG